MVVSPRSQKNTNGVVTVSGRTTLRELFASVIRNRSLLRHLIQREIAGRYRGSLLGILWSFLNPLVMLAVYTVVFGYVFKSRWGNSNESVEGFALVLFAGLIVFNLFSECIGRAPSLILSNANYVKKMVFPLELLPWVSLGAAFFHFVMGLSIVVVFNLLVNHAFQWTILLLPVLLLPLCLCIVGLSWMLAALGVFLRDIGQMIGLALSVLMFLSPLFYPVSALPERVRPLLYLNPLTYIIEQARGLILWGQFPDLYSFFFYLAGATALAYAGFYFFQRARKGFADVL